MPRGIREILLPKTAGSLVAPAILLIILLYMYTNGAAIFGDLWSGFQPVILVYLLFIVAAAAITPKLFTTNPSAPWYLELLAYIGPAVITNVVILLLGVRLSGLGPTAPQNSIAVIALQIGITGSEELFFRAALYKTGVLISSVGFGLFHGVAYGFNPINIVFAVSAGIAFFIIYDQTKDRFGWSINGGIHVGFNTGLLGVALIPFLLH